ncbi:hypothetical protein M0804_015587 [Polistes exclamans]|nr:hypothetical protein M0804_015587 [Polistes exclamans]
MHSRDFIRIEACLKAWQEAKRALVRAIKTAKVTAWQDFLSTIEEDPWGRPYRLVQACNGEDKGTCCSGDA